MQPEIKTISYGRVNSYLVKTGEVFVLIDTGFPPDRSKLEKDLEKSGCRPGNLKLIILTHGDFDHTGNAAHFRKKYGAPIVMHHNEVDVVVKGDMLASRKDKSRLMKLFSRAVLILLLPIIHMGSFERFKPDLEVEDGDDLSRYGFKAKILHIPGHSRGSIGILTDTGDLFCGDLLVSGDKPVLNSLIDDLATAKTSLEKLKSLDINTIYPGHGRPFQGKDLPA